MAKAKTVFICKECGNESSKWLGQCPACKQWDTMVEQKLEKNIYKSNRRTISDNKAVVLSQVSSKEDERMTTNIGELDRVLGSGIVKGSLVLVGGDPGIGKSTL